MTITQTQNARIRITDADVYAALHDGDHDAWTRLHAALSGYLTSVLVTRHLVARDATDEIVQDTWGQAWAHRASFARDGIYAVGPLINWLVRIAVNRRIDQGRRRRFQRTMTSAEMAPESWAGIWLDKATDEPGPEALAVLAERHDRARALLQIAADGMRPATAMALPYLVVDRPGHETDLARRHRSMRTLQRRDSGGAVELAAATGMTRSGAKSRCSRARIAGRQAVCRALGLPPTATLGEALAALDARQEVAV